MDLTRLKRHKDEDWSRLSTKRCKQHKDQVRDWSGLPVGLVETISDNLSVYDYLCFGKVCKSWRSYQEETLQRNRRSGGFPWLVMPKEIETQTLSCISLLEKNKLWQLELPTSSGGLIVGCIEDWLIIVKSVFEFTEIRMSLLNPFTRSEVVLPATFKFEHNLMFSGDPGKQNCVYVLYDELSFDVWIPEAKDWFHCDFDEDVSHDNITNMICFKGCFYLLTWKYNIRVLDAAYVYSTLRTQGYEKEIDTQFYEIEMSTDVQSDIFVFRYLLEFGDEILVVVRFLRFGDFNGAGNCETYDFKVFRLDMCKKEWVKLDNLGDRVICLGRNCSRCYSAKELGGDDMGNCIYFANGFPGTWNCRDIKLPCSMKEDDWGIFRLNSGGGSERFSYIINLDKRPPVWITAPLWWYFNKFRP